jgi:NAD(P)-dependent dehydrogenase (short-subunit alcohol dehydrogenase family)
MPAEVGLFMRYNLFGGDTEDNMRIAIIDGQGGGIGKAIVERLREELGSGVDILALGTNPLATSLMLKSGASEGASGENAIVVNAPKVDIIIGSIGIIAANAMLGEVTSAMAAAVASSEAQKILIPLNRCGIQVAGTGNQPLPFYVGLVVEAVKFIFLSAQ